MSIPSSIPGTASCFSADFIGPRHDRILSIPLGYGREIYFWSFVVAVLLFAFGAGVSLYQGVSHVLDPEPVLSAILRQVVTEIRVLGMCFRESAHNDCRRLRFERDDRWRGGGSCLACSSFSAFGRWASDMSNPPHFAVYLSRAASPIPCTRCTLATKRRSRVVTKKAAFFESEPDTMSLPTYSLNGFRTSSTGCVMH